MKYLSVLSQRNLESSTLPLIIQKKIKEVDKLNKQVVEYSRYDDLDEEELQSIEDIKVKIAEFDNFLVDRIRAYNPEIHQKKLAAAIKARNSRYKTEEEPVAAEQVIQQQEISEIKEVVPAVPTEVPPTQEEKVVVQPKKVAIDKASLNKKLDELKENVNIPVPKEQEIEYAEEDTEFSKESDTEPKKMSKGLILMGIGAFFLTWGAVNFFKDRRG